MLKTRSGRPPSQNEAELRGFIALLQEAKVTHYLEIGARHGDTFFEVMTNLPFGSEGVAVDLPGALWGQMASRPALESAINDLRERSYGVSVLFGDSHTSATQKLIVGRGPYDAILIDGDHTLAGVTRDWDLYRSLAPMVAFHDIVGTSQSEKVSGRPVEVPLLWQTLRTQYQYREFISEGSKMGIGVVWTGQSLQA